MNQTDHININRGGIAHTSLRFIFQFCCNSCQLNCLLTKKKEFSSVIKDLDNAGVTFMNLFNIRSYMWIANLRPK